MADLVTYKPGQGQSSRSIVLYGRSGTGKTTMLATIPGQGLVIEVPQLEGSGSDVLVGQEDHITVTPIKEWDELEEAYQHLVRDNGTIYKWVALDTVTDLVVLARHKILKDREKSLASDPHKLTLPERGQINTLVEDMIYKFRKLSAVVIWIAQERTFGDDGEPKYLGPSVPPGVLTPLVSGAMLVARLVMAHEISGPERRLYLAPSPNHYTKVRTRPGIKIPSATRTLEFPKLIAYFQGRAGAEIDMAEVDTVMVLQFEDEEPAQLAPIAAIAE